jgi:hypothetical protein
MDGSERLSSGIDTTKKKKQSGIPTGNAGEYFVMGELLRRGFDAQLADRNTKGYDVLVGQAEGKTLHKVQIKAVRSPPWYVMTKDFDANAVVQVTIYVLIGPPEGNKAVRFFVTRNICGRPPACEGVEFDFGELVGCGHMSGLSVRCL